MRLFVVLDTKGSGRVLGVFDNVQQAEQITLRYPEYYHLHFLDLMEEPMPTEPSDPPAGEPYRSPAEIAPRPDVVHVVLGTMGHFRALGVTVDRRRAELLLQEAPAYCWIYECEVNRINPQVLDWAGNDEQRGFLARLMGPVTDGR
jgi:hypothetical protein